MIVRSFIDMPPRIGRLPVDGRGYPIPCFVATLADGSRDFRIVSNEHFYRAVKRKLCWICGEPLGRFLAFVIGPMCAINRISSEPPSHRECAVFAARNCPFLANPDARRPAKPKPGESIEPPGLHLERNPGVACVWITQSYDLMKVGEASMPGRAHLITIGEPTAVFWYARGEPASRAEIEASINGGLPFLEEAAREDGPEGIAALEAQVQRFHDARIMPQ